MTKHRVLSADVAWVVLYIARSSRSMYICTSTPCTNSNNNRRACRCTVGCGLTFVCSGSLAIHERLVYAVFVRSSTRSLQSSPADGRRSHRLIMRTRALWA